MRDALPRRRYRKVVGIGVAVLALAMLLTPLVGPTNLSFTEVWRNPLQWDDNPSAAVFFVARLPRVLLSALVGAGLSLCGVVFQALLRNPLASPYTLGISSGSALGAFVGMRFARPGTVGELLIPGCSLLGALLTAMSVFALATRRGKMPPAVLLLAGVTVNYTLGALILLIQYFSDHTMTVRMVRWMMGDMDGATYRLLFMLAIGGAPAFFLLLRRGLALNLLGLGEEEAESQGLRAERAVLSSLLLSAWITGLAVAAAGPVGFVGIIVPHAVRLLGGADNRIVLPGAALLGAAFLVFCDTLARTVMTPIELPVGILTASFGGPFFLALLLRRGSVHD